MNSTSKNTTIQTVLLLIALILSATTGQSQQPQPEIEGWDISTIDARIADAVAKAGAPLGSTESRLIAAAAYIERANVFYNAGRPVLYKLAMGDYRRALRFQPDNVEARQKLEQLISIYQAMMRPVPENGGDTDIYNDPSVRYKVKPQQITFSTRKSFAIFSETLPPDVGYVYEISANVGQQIRIRLSSRGGAAFVSLYQGRIEEASKLASVNTRWDGVAPATGNYLIRVASKDRTVTYKLKVSVR